MDIKIEYDGKYPNLCSGELIVIIDGKKWFFGSALVSGGSVTFDDEWSEIVKDGEWSIANWPDGFPNEYKQAVIDKINYELPHGCCGGCV